MKNILHEKRSQEIDHVSSDNFLSFDSRSQLLLVLIFIPASLCHFCILLCYIYTTYRRHNIIRLQCKRCNISKFVRRERVRLYYHIIAMMHNFRNAGIQLLSATATYLSIVLPHSLINTHYTVDNTLQSFATRIYGFSV